MRMIVIFLFLPFIQSAQTMSVSEFGIYPNDNIEDTEKLNELFEHANSEGIQTILFEEGTYNVSELRLKYPIELVGINNKTILKRTANRPKFGRLLTISGDMEEKRAVIKNLIFDGNIENQGDYSNYKLEQQHLIFVSGNKNVHLRTRVLIQDCTFIKSAGDGITVFVNAEVVINNCKAKDIYRGAFVSNGGNSIITIDNYLIESGEIIKNPGIDFEVIRAGFGNSKKVVANLSNIVAPGKFHVGVLDKSVIKLKNIKTLHSDFYINARDSEVYIDDSEFNLRASNSNKIYNANKLIIKNSSFRLIDESNTTLFIIMWLNKKEKFRNNYVQFTNTVFSSVQKNKSVFLFGTDDLTSNNKLILDNVKYNNFNYLIETKRGGRMVLKNMDVKQKNPLLLNYQKVNNRGLDVELINSKINQNFSELKNEYNTFRGL